MRRENSEWIIVEYLTQLNELFMLGRSECLRDGKKCQP